MSRKYLIYFLYNFELSNKQSKSSEKRLLPKSKFIAIFELELIIRNKLLQ